MSDRHQPGRPREFDEKEMLRRIMTLFWRSGFEGVSLADIMKETGLRKASLYAAFGDKRSMYLKALGQYEIEAVHSAAEALRDTSTAPLDRIEAFLAIPLNALKKNDRSGCFLCNASADQADNDTPTKRQVKRGFERLAYAAARPVQELRPHLTSEEAAATAQTLLSIYVGLRVMVRGGASVSSLKPCIAQGLRLVT